MKPTHLAIIVLCSTLALSGCAENKKNNDFDTEGRLLVEKLTSSKGSLSFKPMTRFDSTSVRGFWPTTYFYKGHPYTGSVAFYNQHGKLGFTGHLKNGLAENNWKFYFATGGVYMEGWYIHGLDVGLWRSYYGYNKPMVDIYYDNYGYILMRTVYFDNGRVKNYCNIKCPLFDDKAKSYTLNRHGDTLYVSDKDTITFSGSFL